MLYAQKRDQILYINIYITNIFLITPKQNLYSFPFFF